MPDIRSFEEKLGEIVARWMVPGHPMNCFLLHVLAHKTGDWTLRLDKDGVKSAYKSSYNAEQDATAIALELLERQRQS